MSPTPTVGALGRSVTDEMTIARSPSSSDVALPIVAVGRSVRSTWSTATSSALSMPTTSAVSACAVGEGDRDRGGSFDGVGRREQVAVGSIDHAGPVAVARWRSARRPEPRRAARARPRPARRPRFRVAPGSARPRPAPGSCRGRRRPHPAGSRRSAAEPSRAAAEPMTHTRAATFGRLTIVTDCDAPPGPSSDGCRHSRSSGGSGG